MATPKISIIVPVYNTEQYLKQCIDSITSQTLEDIEIIIVDDGSKEECIGKRFHAGAPSFSIAATSETVIEYYEALLKEPIDL